MPYHIYIYHAYINIHSNVCSNNLIYLFIYLCMLNYLICVFRYKCLILIYHHTISLTPHNQVGYRNVFFQVQGLGEIPTLNKSSIIVLIASAGYK